MDRSQNELLLSAVTGSCRPCLRRRARDSLTVRFDPRLVVTWKLYQSKKKGRTWCLLGHCSKCTQRSSPNVDHHTILCEALPTTSFKRGRKGYWGRVVSRSRTMPRSSAQLPPYVGPVAVVSSRRKLGGGRIWKHSNILQRCTQSPQPTAHPQTEAYKFLNHKQELETHLSDLRSCERQSPKQKKMSKSFEPKLNTICRQVHCGHDKHIPASVNVTWCGTGCSSKTSVALMRSIPRCLFNAKGVICAFALPSKFQCCFCVTALTLCPSLTLLRHRAATLKVQLTDYRKKKPTTPEARNMHTSRSLVPPIGHTTYHTPGTFSSITQMLWHLEITT